MSYQSVCPPRSAMSDHVFCRSPALLILLHLYLRQVPSLLQPAHVYFRDGMEDIHQRNVRVSSSGRCGGANLLARFGLRGKLKICNTSVALRSFSRQRNCTISHYGFSGRQLAMGYTSFPHRALQFVGTVAYRRCTVNGVLLHAVGHISTLYHGLFDFGGHLCCL